MSSVRVGVLYDPFDPVNTGHITFCRSAISGRKLDRVLLILQDPEGSSCGASRTDRWRMLTASCAVDKSLVPVDTPALSSALKHKFNADKLITLSLPSESDCSLCPSVAEYCDALGLYGRVPTLKNASSHLEKLFSALNPHRFAHSLAVAAECRRLAMRFGVDPVKAEEAGLLHDCAKCLPLSDMQKLVLDGGIPAETEVLASGGLLHSLAGVLLARSLYGIDDPDILSAIEYHNTGRAGMSKLAMVVCLADYIEPNRDPFPNLEETRRLAGISLEKALLFSLENTMDHVLSRGRWLHPRTQETVQWLRTLPAVTLPD